MFLGLKQKSCPILASPSLLATFLSTVLGWFFPNHKATRASEFSVNAQAGMAGQGNGAALCSAVAFCHVVCGVCRVSEEQR